MGCCGQATTAILTERHRMRVHYLGGRPVVIRGPVTRTEYIFSGINREQLVDPRDAVVIIRNRLFRVEGVEEIQAK